MKSFRHKIKMIVPHSIFQYLDRNFFVKVPFFHLFEKGNSE